MTNCTRCKSLILGDGASVDIVTGQPGTRDGLTSAFLCYECAGALSDFFRGAPAGTPGPALLESSR